MNETPRQADDPSWLAEQLALVEACMRERVAFRWNGPGTFLIDVAGAPAVVNAVATKGFEVIGLEGFEIDGLVIHPRLDLIWDAERSPGTPFDALERFGAGVWVDITLA